MIHISWILVAIALYGTYLNSEQDRRGFYFWIFSNIGFMMVNLANGQLPQAVLFAAYAILAIRGLWCWR